jgi:hypothetical protein
MGDAGLTAEQASLNLRMAPFYAHFLTIVRDSQAADASFPNYVPDLGMTGGGAVCALRTLNQSLKIVRVCVCACGTADRRPQRQARGPATTKPVCVSAQRPRSDNCEPPPSRSPPDSRRM